MITTGLYSVTIPYIKLNSARELILVILLIYLISERKFGQQESQVLNLVKFHERDNEIAFKKQPK